MIELKEVETFIEIDICKDGEKIGQCEIKAGEEKLDNFVIYPPYQNKGYGQEALARIIEKYDIRRLWVAEGNERARHIYEKFGFSDNGDHSYHELTRIT